jgi:hypothetical protein
MGLEQQVTFRFDEHTSKRQSETEGATLPESTVHPDAAALEFNNSCANSQAQAAAPFFLPIG